MNSDVISLTKQNFSLADIASPARGCKHDDADSVLLNGLSKWDVQQ